MGLADLPHSARWPPGLAQGRGTRSATLLRRRRGSDAIAADVAVRVLGGVALVAVAAVAVAIAVAAAAVRRLDSRHGNAEAKIAAQVQQLLAGIPQSGATLGNPRAPVTMTYYSDLQCPVCAEFTLSSGFPELMANDVRAGKVKIVYRPFDTATRDPQTFQAQQVAALAAGKQNHFWDYVELFYRQQGTEGTDYVTEQLPQRTGTAGPSAGPQHVAQRP